MPVRQGLQAVIVVLLTCVGYGAPAWSASEAGEAPKSAERRLEDALKALQASGMNLVFSNSLVKPAYRVSAETDPGAPLPDRAANLLSPFGLALEKTDADVWYVVRSGAAETPVRQSPAPRDEAPSPRIIEEVVVSSSRHQLVRDSHERRGLDARELEVVPSLGRDLLRAVSHLPGHASVGISARSHMRGGNTNEVLYLVDGVQIIEPFHMADFHALFSAINPGLVDSIDVYHAGFPAAFGSRLSGVVDMELAEADEPLEARINVDFVNAATQLQGQEGDAEWLLSARRSTVDHLLGYVERDYGRPKFHDELMRVSWEGEDSHVTAGMLYANDELRLKDSTAGERARADYHNLASWLRAGRAYGDTLDVELSASYTAIDNDRRGSLEDPTNAVGHLQESRQFTVAAFQAGVRWRPSKEWLFHAGFEGQRQDAELGVDIEARYGMLGQQLQPVDLLMRNVSTDRSGRLLTAFVSAQNQVSSAVTVELGWRFDVQHIDPVHDSQFSPRVQITYDDGGRWRGFLNVGRYAQHQNLYELQLDDDPLELNDPQLSDQVSVGTEWAANDQWRLRLEGYWRRIDDPWARFENLYNRWVLLPELHADRLRLAPEAARTFGTELVVDYRPRENLRWSVSAAVARAEEQLDGLWQPRPWEQRRTWRGSLDWRPGGWRIGISAAYHTGWPTTSLVTEPLVGFDRLYDSRLPGYFSVDIHTARRFQLPQSELEVYFDLSNATSAKNIGGYRYELDRGVLVRDARKLLPPVPVLGMSWSW